MIKNRTRQLVAWTENGRVRMIPSLVEQFARPFRERIEEIEGTRPHDFREQPKYLIELSRAYEALGHYYERLGYHQEAFDAYVAAAVEVTCVDDFWWCDCDDGAVLSQPFWGRFFAMYAQCRRLFRKHPFLKNTASYETLLHEFDYVTAPTDIWHEEFDEAMETLHAWRFGA